MHRRRKRNYTLLYFGAAAPAATRRHSPRSPRIACVHTLDIDACDAANVVHKFSYANGRLDAALNYHASVRCQRECRLLFAPTPLRVRCVLASKAVNVIVSATVPHTHELRVFDLEAIKSRVRSRERVRCGTNCSSPPLTARTGLICD